MALFTNKRDSGLPLLTKVYQIDSGDEAELAAFLRSEGDSVNSILWEMDLYEVLPERQHHTVPGIAKGIREARQDLARVVRLTQGVMRSVCHHQAISVGAVREIEARREHIRFHIDHEEDLALDTQVPIAALVPAVFNASSTATATRIMRDLSALVLDAIAGRVALDACLECESVFIVQRSGHQFCSHRCAHRVTERRRYAKLFEMEI